jgi:hypothetical protein
MYLIGSLGLSCRYMRFLFCLGCSSRGFFTAGAHYFNACVPIAQQAGQAAVLGDLSLCLCLWLRQAKKEAARNQRRGILRKKLWYTSTEEKKEMI